MREDVAEDQLCLLLARRHLPPDVQRRVRELLAGPLRWLVVVEQKESFRPLDASPKTPNTHNTGLVFADQAAALDVRPALARGEERFSKGFSM